MVDWHTSAVWMQFQWNYTHHSLKLHLYHIVCVWTVIRLGGLGGRIWNHIWSISGIDLQLVCIVSALQTLRNYFTSDVRLGCYILSSIESLISWIWIPSLLDYNPISWNIQADWKQNGNRIVLPIALFLNSDTMFFDYESDFYYPKKRYVKC